MTYNGIVTNCYYLSTCGVSHGIGSIGSGGDLEAQRAEAKSTNEDLTFEQFLTWIEQQ